MGLSIRRPLLPLLLFLFPLLYTVSVLQQRWNPEETKRLVSPKRPDQVILGPAAGQGLPNRLQCQGTKAMNRIEPSPKNSHSEGEKVSFVTVFAIYKSDPMNEKMLDRVRVGDISYNSKSERSLAILDTYIDFIQVSMPSSDVVVLTDPDSAFSLDRNNAIKFPIEGDYSRSNLMLQRIKSYIAYLKRILESSELEKANKNIIFSDSDIAVVDNLGDIFQKHPDFHIALTFRNNKNQPLNSGFIAVRGTRDGMSKSKDFLEEVLDIYMSKYMGASRMLGDQLALYWVIKLHLPSAIQKFNQHESFSGKVKGVSVLFLPCAIYNWTPPEGAGQFHGMPLDVKIVHFKGSRKRLMLEAWNFYKSTSNMSNMLCLILCSGRTKYDF
ncbi:Dihydroflavonol-4-reductase [Rhynchospora pubera]|uniref:Dihydroflavonol-4-reductase n=1 Tax=Rhynchospora pubera TaxID=906938 RepID=A0AAV8H1M8_9POAL|nr:Dihydroflavonol-4-reductase [Rhynchospora pubera]